MRRDLACYYDYDCDRDFTIISEYQTLINSGNRYCRNNIASRTSNRFGKNSKKNNCAENMKNA